MGLNSHFNKIINIYFLDKDGNETKDKILCPTQGRKPEIEIVGKFQPSQTGGSIPAFTITVTNLYYNLGEFQYPKIKVEAGYRENLATFKGSIISIFQENPGPDGKTVICCYLGSVQNWLNSYVDVDLDEGTTLKNAVTEISNSLELNTEPNVPPTLQGLTLPSRFAMNGNASEVLNQLFNLFPEKNIHFSEINSQVCLYSVGDTKTETEIVRIDYLSSPPQKNAGGDNGAYYTVFTAPWNPMVMPGVKVIFPAWKYIKFFNLVNADTTENAIIVQFVQIHFSTIGSTNQMQVQGLGVSL